MKFIPDDLACLGIPLVTFGIVAGLLIMGIEFNIGGKNRAIYESWPEFWIILPLIFLGFNLFFVLIEKSILGVVSVTTNIGWLIYSKITYQEVLNILGRL